MFSLDIGQLIKSLLSVKGKNQKPPHKWEVLGGSAIGSSHLNNHIPCQDAYHLSMITKDLGIAIVSDGAGSCAYAHHGSAFLVERAATAFTEMIYQHQWNLEQALPSDEIWKDEAFQTMLSLRKELNEYATREHLPFEELSATLIVVLFSSQGLLVSHIGDGRAGYCNGQGEWKSAILPYQGEEVGSTVFITHPFDQYPDLVESRIIREPIRAFTLLSDGCEKLCWRTIESIPGQTRLAKPNKPFEPFFEQTVALLGKIFSDRNTHKLQQEWEQYLLDGHEALKEEYDDKTMIIGIQHSELYT